MEVQGCYIVLSTMIEKQAARELNYPPELKHRFKDGFVTILGPFENTEQAINEMQRIQNHIDQTAYKYRPRRLKDKDFDWGW